MADSSDFVVVMFISKKASTAFNVNIYTCISLDQTIKKQTSESNTALHGWCKCREGGALSLFADVQQALNGHEIHI